MSPLQGHLPPGHRQPPGGDGATILHSAGRKRLRLHTPPPFSRQGWLTGMVVIHCCCCCCCPPPPPERDPRPDREVLRQRVSGGGDREAAGGEPQAEGQLLTSRQSLASLPLLFFLSLLFPMRLPVDLVTTRRPKRTIEEMPPLSGEGRPRLDTCGASWCCRGLRATGVLCVYVCVRACNKA